MQIRKITKLNTTCCGVSIRWWSLSLWELGGDGRAAAQLLSTIHIRWTSSYGLLHCQHGFFWPSYPQRPSRNGIWYWPLRSCHQRWKDCTPSPARLTCRDTSQEGHWCRRRLCHGKTTKWFHSCLPSLTKWWYSLGGSMRTFISKNHLFSAKEKAQILTRQVLCVFPSSSSRTERTTKERDPQSAAAQLP